MNPATRGGFIEFITNVMGVPSSAMFNPSTDPVVGYAFNFALQFINQQLQTIPNPGTGWSLSTIATYNLAADTLINWEQDPSNAPVYKDGLQYWAWLRKTYGVLNFVPGVIQSTSDEGTSSSYAVAEQFNNYTIANLQNLKTPYGRQYLAIAGSWGSLWGIN